MDYEYDWQTCNITSREWEDMLIDRKGWRMVSASVLAGLAGPMAYVFWERNPQSKGE